MPPTKVTQRAAPKAVEKQRRWASFKRVMSIGECRPIDFDPKVSGENTAPTAKNAAAVRNLVIQPIFEQDFRFNSVDARLVEKENNTLRKSHD